jgi:hypothetical protein
VNFIGRISGAVHSFCLIRIQITRWLSWPIAIADALGRCWFILAIQLIAVLLVYLPQGREAIFAAAEPSRPLQSFLLFVAICVCSIQATFFASAVLERRPAFRTSVALWNNTRLTTLPLSSDFSRPS